jgi:hypothetical protein
MTKNQIARESWWVRLGRELFPGLCAISVLGGMPAHRAAAMWAYAVDRRTGSSRDREAAR